MAAASRVGGGALLVAVTQRQLAQECTDDTNALDGDPRW